MQVTVPPERYTHYDGPVIERLLTLDEVRKFCQQIGVGFVDACAGLVTGTDGSQSCLIILPLDGFDTIAAYRRHELAHCAGWPADHTDR